MRVAYPAISFIPLCHVERSETSLDFLQRQIANHESRRQARPRRDKCRNPFCVDQTDELVSSLTSN